MKNNILIYIFIVFLTVCFVYIFNSHESQFLLYVILALPIVDFLSILFVKNHINLLLEISKDAVCKGDSYNVKIIINNKSIVPVSYLNFFVNCNDIGISGKECSKEVSVGIKEQRIINLDFKAAHIGVQNITLDRYEIHGIFGLFTKKINCMNQCKIVIKPRILEIANMKLIENLGQKKQDNGFTDSDSITITSDVSSDYKQYVKGESLSRINWKILSKTGEIVSRKSMNLSSQGNIILIFDTNFESSEYNLQINDDLLEVFISVANYYYRKLNQVKIYIDSLKSLDSMMVCSKIDISKLQNHIIQIGKTSKFDSSKTFNDLKGNNAFYLLITSRKLKNYEEFLKMKNSSIIYVGTHSVCDNKIYLGKIVDNKCIIEGQ